METKTFTNKDIKNGKRLLINGNYCEFRHNENEVLLDNRADYIEIYGELSDEQSDSAKHKSWVTIDGNELKLNTLSTCETDKCLYILYKSENLALELEEKKIEITYQITEFYVGKLKEDIIDFESNNDVIIVCKDNKELQAKKKKLITSDYFDMLLKRHPDLNRFSLDIYDKKIVKICLEHIYTGIIFPKNIESLDEAIELYEASLYLQLNDLKNQMTFIFTRMLNFDNLERIYALANEYDIQSLIENIAKFVVFFNNRYCHTRFKIFPNKTDNIFLEHVLNKSPNNRTLRDMVRENMSKYEYRMEEVD
jgi:hypothetical protein